LNTVINILCLAAGKGTGTQKAPIRNTGDIFFCHGICSRENVTGIDTFWVPTVPLPAAKQRIFNHSIQNLLRKLKKAALLTKTATSLSAVDLQLSAVSCSQGASLRRIQFRLFIKEYLTN